MIPAIAFSGGHDRPPIMFINHNDHKFWIGTHIADLLVNLRESGRRLAHDRRDISPERNALLPTVIEPPRRTLLPHEAKAQLGLPGDSVVILSMARKIKYRSEKAFNFAECHVPLLLKYRNIYLIAVGAGLQDDWTEAIGRTDGTCGA